MLAANAPGCRLAHAMLRTSFVMAIAVDDDLATACCGACVPPATSGTGPVAAIDPGGAPAQGNIADLAESLVRTAPRGTTVTVVAEERPEVTSRLSNLD